MDQHKLAEELRRQAQQMVADVSTLEQEIEEFDFKLAFARILGKEDWTDKLAKGARRVRDAFHQPHKDTELSEDLKSLIPDMKAVAAAYEEMTRGYKEFIREVWEAQNQRRPGLQASR